MASILDTTQLSKETFEGAIAVGMTTAQILTMFGKTGAEMCKWCGENYGIPQFSVVYDMVKQACYLEFLTTVKALGYRGNPSALNIINNAINSAAADSTVKIVFENKVALEQEEDKKDDE